MSVLSVDEIDFLPAGFHDRRRQRRARRLLWVVATAFIGTAALGFSGNRVLHIRLAAERDRIRPQAESVADLGRRLADARSKLELETLRSDLRARMRLRASMTRLLAAVAEPLPRHAALTELRYRIETPSESAAAVPPAVPPNAAALTSRSPERRDLDRLTYDSESLRPVFMIQGIAADDAVVSEYLAALGHSGLFRDVRLLITDRYDHRGHLLRSFAAKLAVRGLKPGPAAAEAKLAAVDGGKK